MIGQVCETRDHLGVDVDAAQKHVLIEKLIVVVQKLRRIDHRAESDRLVVELETASEKVIILLQTDYSPPAHLAQVTRVGRSDEHLFLIFAIPANRSRRKTVEATTTTIAAKAYISSNTLEKAFHQGSSFEVLVVVVIL